MVYRNPPYPYSFLLRKLDQIRSQNVGFLTKLFDEPGVPWTEDVFGGIPGVLNRGGSEINFGENVEYNGWDRLDRGGMGAEFANDRTRYRYSVGLYCGDQNEIYPQPRVFVPTATDGDVAAWEPDSAVFPPSAESMLVAAGVTDDSTFKIQDGTLFRVGAGCRFSFSCLGNITEGSRTITIDEDLFSHFDDDEQISIAIDGAGSNFGTLITSVEKNTSVTVNEIVRPSGDDVIGGMVTWYYERRIESITPTGVGTEATIVLSDPIVNLSARVATAIAASTFPVLIQLDQQVKDILVWRIPAAVPDALVAPTFAPQLAHDKKSEHMVEDDRYYFVFTKMSPWGESLPSPPSNTTSPFTIDRQRAIAIQFGSNDASFTESGGVTYAAHSKDYPGVTGYKIYMQRIEADDPATGSPGLDYKEEKLKFVAEIGVRSNQQVSGKLKPRYVFDGSGSREGRPPEYVAGASDTRRDMVIIVTSDGVRTYLYELKLAGQHSTLAPIQPVLDTNEAITPGIRGTVLQGSCTIWDSQLVLPTTDADGKRSITRVWYDSSKGLHADGYSLKFRVRSMEGILGHLVYAENTRRLWRCYHNLAWWSSDPFGGDPDWTGPIAIGTNGYDVAQMIAYGGAKNSSDSAMYFTKPDGLYRILDTSDGPSRRAEWITTFGVPDLNYGYPLVDHRGELYIGIGENLLRYTIANVDLTGPNRDGGLPQSLRGWCGGAVSTNRHLYVGTGMRHPDTTHYFYQQILETEQGEAWHQMRWLGLDGNDFEEVLPEYADLVDPPDGVGWGPILQVVPADLSPASGDIVDGNGWATLVATTGFHDGILISPIRNAGERLREARGYQARPGTTMLELPKTFSGNNRPLDQVWHYIRVAQSKLTNPTDYTGFRVQIKQDSPYWPVDYDWETITVSKQDTVGDPYPAYGEYLYVNVDVAELIDLTGANPHSIYLLESAIQWISGGGRGITRSPGIAFRLDINQIAATTTPDYTAVPLVLNDIVLASSPTNASLGRWIFEATLKRFQRLSAPNDSGLIMDNQHDWQFWDAYEQLQDFAKSSDPVILTDALGAEHVCRMDLGHLTPGKDGLKTWTRSDGAKITEPFELKYTVTFTELYNLKDLTMYLHTPPIDEPIDG